MGFVYVSYARILLCVTHFKTLQKISYRTSKYCKDLTKFIIANQSINILVSLIHNFFFFNYFGIRPLNVASVFEYRGAKNSPKWSNSDIFDYSKSKEMRMKTYSYVRYKSSSHLHENFHFNLYEKKKAYVLLNL